jgi:hypothetical protein
MGDDGNRAESAGVHVPGEGAIRPPPDSRRPSSILPGPEGEYDDDAPRVSLGPLGLLGFGPRPPADMSREGAQGGPSALMTAASLVIVIAALKVARPVLVPLTVSAFLAVLTAPFGRIQFEAC